MRNIYGKRKTFLFILFFNFSMVGAQSPYESINKMLDQIQTLETVEFNLLLKERVEGKIIKSSSYVKCNFNPYKIYFYQRFPNHGLEIIYNEEEYGDKAIINTNSFPYINLNLSPHHQLMRKNKHHTLYEGSVFKYMGGLTEHILKINANFIEFIDSGQVKINELVCHKILLIVKNYNVIDYKVKENENVYTISLNMKIEDHKILELNELKDYEDIRPGQTIKIPNFYAKEFQFYIDLKTNLPVYIKIYDQIGLYEEYYFSNLRINEKYPQEVFKKEYPEYGF